MDGCAGLAGWLEGDHRHGCRDEKELQSCAEPRGRSLDSCCHGHEETTPLLLLDHNEDSEPFPQTIVGENLSLLFQNSVMLADILFFFVLLYAINRV